MMKISKKRLFAVACVLLALPLAGCASGIDVKQTSAQEALSVVQLDVHWDGVQATGGLTEGGCLPEFAFIGQRGTTRPVVERLNGQLTYLLRSAPGQIAIKGFSCHKYAGLHSKTRSYKFQALPYFTASAGYINYAGKLRIDYTTSGFGAVDIIGAEDKEAKVTVNVVDDYNDAQKQYLWKYKEIPAGFSFKRSLFDAKGLVINKSR